MDELDKLNELVYALGKSDKFRNEFNGLVGELNKLS